LRRGVTFPAGEAARPEKVKADRWNGVLPTAIYSGAPVPFLNVTK